MPRSSSPSSDLPADDQTPPQPAWTTGWQRLSQTFIRPPRREAPAPPPTPSYQGEDLSLLSDAEKRARIVRLDPLERKIGFAAAALAAIVALIVTVPYMVSKIAVTTTTKPSHRRCPIGLTYVTHGTAAATCRGVLPLSHYAIYIVVYLALATAILVTVLIRRRSAVAFTTAITGVAFGSAYLLVPFVLVGGWILLRGWRTQKYGAPNAKSVLPGYAPPPGRGTSRRRPDAAASRTGRSGRGAGATTSAPPRPPKANKRYTPKAPPKPAKKR